MLNVVVTGTEPLFKLDEAKAHLRVDTGDDDAIIQTYSDAAVSRVLQYCNIALVPDDERAKAAFKVAALLVLGDLYEQRAGDRDQLNRTASLLVDPYRWLRV